MKKEFAIVALTLGVFAQAQTTVSTTVNIKLTDVISIDVESIAKNGTVSFNYITSEEYNTTKNIMLPKSLIVTSSKNFDVKVRAEGENFMNGVNVITVDVLQIEAVGGGTMVGTFKKVTLSTEDQELVSNAAKGAKRSLSIEYSIPAEKASTVLLGKEPETYTQKVKYTIIAR